MALKTNEKTPEESAKIAAPATTVLELALYKIYTWQGHTYEQGKPYRFKNEDAMVLLSEQDIGRQVWKLYRPAPKAHAPKTEIQDATSVHASRPPEDTWGISTVNKEQKRVDIGDDSEIQDVLGAIDADTDGNITV